MAGVKQQAIGELQRCDWCTGDALYQAYHDKEWGVPVTDRQDLFERLILEGMQAGLSWLTVLKKRAHMQQRFFGFDIDRLSASGEAEVLDWLSDAGLIRHRGKLEAMLGNARLAQQDNEFADLLWSFAPQKHKARKTRRAVPSETPDSQAMSKALKRAGYRFVGPTICYAFMQSVGMVNDHVVPCCRYESCETLQVAVRGR